MMTSLDGLVFCKVYICVLKHAIKWLYFVGSTNHWNLFEYPLLFFIAILHVSMIYMKHPLFCSNSYAMEIPIKYIYICIYIQIKSHMMMILGLSFNINLLIRSPCKLPLSCCVNKLNEVLCGVINRVLCHREQTASASEWLRAEIIFRDFT